MPHKTKWAKVIREYNVHELMTVLQTLPPDMMVEISPITNAWLGASSPLRVYDAQIYNDEGDRALPMDEGAHLVLSAHEVEEEYDDD
jgi:hypothetical protein